MTSHDADHPRPIDARQIDALNRYIDGLADGLDRPSADLDPQLIVAVCSIHGPEASAPEIAPGRAEEDRLWRDLMQLRPRPELRALPHSPSATMLPTLTSNKAQLPVVSRRGEARPTGRLRQIGGRTLGLVATLTLVALVTLSGLAVWITAPDANSSDPGLFGGIAASPTYPAMVAVGGTPDAVDAVGQVPTDTVRPIYQECTVASRTVENVVEVAARPLDAPRTGPDFAFTLPPRLIMLPEQQGQSPQRNSAGLPQGGTVELGVVNDLSRLYGEYMGCRIGNDTGTLSSAALMTDDGLLRRFWTSSATPELQGYSVILLCTERTILQKPWEVVGQPGFTYLYGFRALDDGRVAAWSEQAPVPGGSGDGSSWKLRLDGDPLNSYVVFVQTPQGWLIDELDPGGRG